MELPGRTLEQKARSFAKFGKILVGFAHLHSKI
jgi:hypothetical protein